MIIYWKWKPNQGNKNNEVCLQVYVELAKCKDNYFDMGSTWNRARMSYLGLQKCLWQSALLLKISLGQLWYIWYL